MMRVNTEQRAAVEEAAWATAQRLGHFGYAEISVGAGVPLKRATVLVRDWAARGLVLPDPGEVPGKRRMFTIAASSDVPAPRSRRSTPEGNMWRAARGLKSFSPVDLAAHASTPECPVDRDGAQAYCNVLLRGDYVRAMRKAVPGKREAIYRLIRDTGPVPPRERRVRAVWDANLGSFTHLPGDLS